jgi:hypothetical protein
MGDKRSGVDEGRKGTVEDIKGKAKEARRPDDHRPYPCRLRVCWLGVPHSLR